MMFAGELAVRCPDFIRGRVLRNAQDLVVVSKLDRHGFRSLGFRVAGLELSICDLRPSLNARREAFYCATRTRAGLSTSSPQR